ncbi:MAG: hypothetical protein HYW48_09580 [Deltaproteobacteria bacterium]|nr:hypothetical protein [Deltaproteobacteria bacterium]
MRTISNPILISLFLSAMISSRAGAETYERCEVRSLNFTQGATGLAAIMECFNVEKTWTLHEGRTPRSLSLPEPCQAGNETTINAYNTAFETMAAVAGRCTEVAGSIVPVTVGGIEANQTFFYMALKDNLVLSKVTIESGNITSAELTLSGRIAFQPAKEFAEGLLQDMPKPLSEIPGLFAAARSEEGGSAGQERGEKCNRAVEKMRKETASLVSKTAKYTAERDKCGN